MNNKAVAILGRLHGAMSDRTAVLVGGVVALIWVLPYGALLPDAVAAIPEAGLMLAGLTLCLLQRRLRKPLVILSLVIIAYWVVLCLLPNVPSAYVAGLGVRKSTLALTGVVVAVGVPSHARRMLVVHVGASLATALMVSIAVHALLPAVESGVDRMASADTGLYDNEARLQGVFAGPFHAALAAVLVLILIPVLARRSRAVAASALLVGSSALYLTSVRSAIVAVVAGLLALALSGGDVRQKLGRAGLVSVAGAVLVLFAILVGGDRFRAALASLVTPWNDPRLLNRVEFYREGWGLVRASPIYGWGPGSAGDAMEAYFADGAHVNSHNLALKLLIEGGLIGAVLWLGLLGLLIVHLWRAGDTDGRAEGVGVLIALLAYGLTGTAIEALPVSTFALLVTAVGALPADPPGRSDSTARVGRLASEGASPTPD